MIMRDSLPSGTVALSNRKGDDDTDCAVEESDPCGRYVRYKEILGRGAFKTVYRAFDEVDGIEVAWNQIKVHDALHSAEDLERFYSEVHLLKSLKHKNIIKLYHSWVDTNANNLNFITEIFTSGTLRQYRKRHKQVDIKAVKSWSRQILRGLLYLHSHDPPIIHRDLKCDNIFVNGNQGEVKIGDLGLAAVLCKAHAAHSVIGTPEFMAPELYEEEYTELVDVYAFGMCLLEMVTFEYPYSECRNAAQIYKKVTSGKKPAALNKVNDPELREFVEKCLATVTRRLSVRELLRDPFLHRDANCKPAESVSPLRRSSVKILPSLRLKEGDAVQNLDFKIRVKRREKGTIYLRLRTADTEGQVRVIHFPFDMEVDTAMCVATEMIGELDLENQDVTKIAELIDAAILTMVPGWRPGVAIDEAYSEIDHHLSEAPTLNEHSKSDGVAMSPESSLLDHSHSSESTINGLALLPPQTEGTVHGRFEEVMYHHRMRESSSQEVEECTVPSDLYSGESCNWEPIDKSSSSVSPATNTSAYSSSRIAPKCAAVASNELVESMRNTGLQIYTNEQMNLRHCGMFMDNINNNAGLSPRNNQEKQGILCAVESATALDNDDQSELVTEELNELAGRYELELRDLQRKHEEALQEFRNRWQQRRGLHSSLPRMQQCNATPIKQLRRSESEKLTMNKNS